MTIIGTTKIKHIAADQIKTAFRFSFNTFAAKPLNNAISSCQACFIDLIIIFLFYYLSVNKFLKISPCYISLERYFSAEYSAINRINLLPLNR